MILVTGSNGYVGLTLIPLLKKSHKVMGVDLSSGGCTDWVNDIGSTSLHSKLKGLKGSEISVVNLAAARFDFGAHADAYYKMNITDHEKFLETLVGFNIKTFIHISSVASMDGKKLLFSPNLNCDDAYRSTKYLQEKLIEEWCCRNNIQLIILYPSAIFSDEHRGDTNIGKMQALSKYIPFVPDIRVKKTLTFLPKFSAFIDQALAGTLNAGKYLTVERPILTVTEIVKILSGNHRRIVQIPFFKKILTVIADFLNVIGGFGRVDLKLTPNRVVKLFSDTSYDDHDLDIDCFTYNEDSSLDLRLILQRFNNIE
jgi:nucleoside-diphosphate-sugar epimerase|tara:strand:- start:1292 stop:2230 length:939 start_codon:yes stop_codon:yes gene_type:complete